MSIATASPVGARRAASVFGLRELQGIPNSVHRRASRHPQLVNRTWMGRAALVPVPFGSLRVILRCTDEHTSVRAQPGHPHAP